MAPSGPSYGCEPSPSSWSGETHRSRRGGGRADASDRYSAGTFAVWFGHSDQRKWHKCHVTRGPGYSRTCVSLDCLTPMQAQTDVLPGAAEFRAWADRPGGSRPAPALRLRRWRPWGSPPATEESATRVPREGPKFNPRITAAPACHLPPCLRLDCARGQMRRRPPGLPSAASCRQGVAVRSSNSTSRWPPAPPSSATPPRGLAAVCGRAGGTHTGPPGGPRLTLVTDVPHGPEIAPLPGTASVTGVTTVMGTPLGRPVCLGWTARRRRRSDGHAGTSPGPCASRPGEDLRLLPKGWWPRVFRGRA